VGDLVALTRASVGPGILEGIEGAAHRTVADGVDVNGEPRLVCACDDAIQIVLFEVRRPSIGRRPPVRREIRLEQRSGLRGILDDTVGEYLDRIRPQKIRVHGPGLAKGDRRRDGVGRGLTQVLDRERAAHAHLKPVLVVETLVDAHVVGVDGGILHGGDSRRSHGGKRLGELRGFAREGHRGFGARHEVGCRVAQRSGRLACRVTLDAAADRVMCRVADVRGAQRRRVRPDRVAVRAVEQERSLLEDAVEIRAREREPGGIHLDDFEPAVPRTGLVGKAASYPPLESGQCDHVVAEIAAILVLRALRGVRVRIDDAGNHYAAREIHRTAPGACERRDRGVRAHADDGFAAQCQGRNDTAFRIFGMNLAVQEDEIGKLISRRFGRLRPGRRRSGGSGECRHQHRAQHPSAHGK